MLRRGNVKLAVFIRFRDVYTRKKAEVVTARTSLKQLFLLAKRNCQPIRYSVTKIVWRELHIIAQLCGKGFFVKVCNFHPFFCVVRVTDSNSMLL